MAFPDSVKPESQLNVHCSPLSSVDGQDPILPLVGAEIASHDAKQDTPAVSHAPSPPHVAVEDGVNDSLQVNAQVSKAFVRSHDDAVAVAFNPSMGGFPEHSFVHVESQQ